MNVHDDLLAIFFYKTCLYNGSGVLKPEIQNSSGVLKVS